jgi:hypothetical protein
MPVNDAKFVATGTLARLKSIGYPHARLPSRAIVGTLGATQPACPTRSRSLP